MASKNESENINEMFADIIRYQRKNQRTALICLAIACVLLAVSVTANVFFIRERTRYEKVTEMQEYSYDFDGDGNNFVTGDNNKIDSKISYGGAE